MANEIELEELEDAEARKTKLRSIVSAQIRYWMAQTNRDVPKLAKDADVSVDAIYKIMQCNRGASIDVIGRLAHALGIPPAVLLMPVE